MKAIIGGLLICFMVCAISTGIIISINHNNEIKEKATYDEGVAAFNNGLTIDACPYSPHHSYIKYENWRHGWGNAFVKGKK